jgi:hypothetical protein
MALRIPFSLSAVALAATAVFLSTAPDVSASDLRLSAGLKGGWSRWGIKLGGDRITSGFAPVGGGEIGLNKGPLFAGLQFTAGRFTFGDRTLCSGGACQRTDNGSAERYQVESGIGWYAQPWLGPYIGYLYQNQRLNFTLSADGESTTRQTIGLFLVGVLLNRSWLGQRAAVYGNLSAVGLGSGDGLGGLGEAGISYAARTFPIGFTFSIRYQFFHFDRQELVLNGMSRTRDEWIGFTAGVHGTK